MKNFKTVPLPVSQSPRLYITPLLCSTWRCSFFMITKSYSSWLLLVKGILHLGQGQWFKTKGGTVFSILLVPASRLSGELSNLIKFHGVLFAGIASERNICSSHMARTVLVYLHCPLCVLVGVGVVSRACLSICSCVCVCAYFLKLCTSSETSSQYPVADCGF